jgi:hypothetical protein
VESRHYLRQLELSAKSLHINLWRNMDPVSRRIGLAARNGPCFLCGCNKPLSNFCFLFRSKPKIRLVLLDEVEKDFSDLVLTISRQGYCLLICAFKNFDHEAMYRTRASSTRCSAYLISTPTSGYYVR